MESFVEKIIWMLLLFIFAKRPLKKLSSMVVEILRLGIYQIIYMDKVPESAAVNESVKLAQKAN